MLKTVWLTEQRDIAKGTAMLLGGFDGLHAGHRLLLSCAKESGFLVGVMTIIGCKEEGIFTFKEREEIFQKAGVDFVFELPFEEIKDMPPEVFLRTLINEFNLQLFVCGEDFRFGAGAKGTPEMIKQATHVRVEVLSLLEMDGEKISSRQIKSLLREGRVEKANVMLSHPFFLKGEVKKDIQIGRTINFPTANIEYPIGKFLLKEGVYETSVTIGEKTYKGITNYGARPTFNNEKITTETYLDGFDGDLYGKELTVEFVRYLRGVEKFESAQALKEQLQNDIRRVREND